MVTSRRRNARCYNSNLTKEENLGDSVVRFQSFFNSNKSYCGSVIFQWEKILREITEKKIIKNTKSGENKNDKMMSC